MCGKTIFTWDSNQDGLVTISDIGNQLQEILLLPSTLTLAAIHQMESVWTFLELDCQSGYGFFAWAFSSLIWLSLFGSASKSR